jgi:hypothetical protein
MSAATDIAEARALLEKAERESDPEQETHHIEEALLLLETTEDLTRDQGQLVANLRTSYARRLLKQLGRYKSAPLDVWFFYFNVLVKLSAEVEALTSADPELAENRKQFIEMWGPEVVAALEKSNAI